MNQSHHSHPNPLLTQSSADIDMSSPAFWRLLGAGLWLVQLLLAYYYAPERIIHTDCAYQFFHLLLEGSFFETGAYRYSAYIPQAIVLGAFHVGLPLSALIVAYSLSFVLIYGVLWWLVSFPFNQPRIGFALLLSLVLSVGLSYFMPVTEIQQALAYAIAFFAACQSNRLPFIWKSLLMLLLAVLAFLAHPGVVIVVGFLGCYAWLNQGKTFNRLGLLLIGCLVLLVVLKLVFTSGDSYEGQFFQQLKRIKSHVRYFFISYTWGYYGKAFFTLYWLPILIWIINNGFYLAQRLWLKFGLSAGAGIAFYLMTIIIYYDGDSDLMMERSFMAFNGIVLVPFFNEVLIHTFQLEIITRRARQFYDLAVSTCLVMYAVWMLYFHLPMIQLRLSTIEQMLTSAKVQAGEKVIVPKSQAPVDKLMVHWAIGVESLLLSAYHDPAQARTIYLAEPDQDIKACTSDAQVFCFTPFYPTLPMAKIPTRFFQLRPQPYRAATIASPAK
jgi:hypothetical protein